MKQPLNRPMRCAVLVACFVALLAHPFVSSASAGLTQEEGDLFLSCLADNDCVLSPTPVGEEQVSGQTFANIVQPETVFFEFIMSLLNGTLRCCPRCWMSLKSISSTKPRREVCSGLPWISDLCLVRT